MKFPMKRLVFTAALVGLVGTLALAQMTPEQREERIQAYRIAVFTDVLNLTTDEAQAFWPAYNEYLDRREDLQKQLKPSQQLDGMSDSEVEDYVKKYFDLRQRELDLEKDLTQKLRKTLPLRKIAKLPVAEREFREKLVKKLQENRERRMERRLGPGGKGKK